MAKSQPTSLYSSSLQVLPENQPSMRPPQQSPKPMAILLPMALYPPLSLQGRRVGPMAGWKLRLSNMANMVRQTGIIGSLAVAGWIGMLFLDAWEEAAEYTRGEWPRRCRFLNELTLQVPKLDRRPRLLRSATSLKAATTPCWETELGEERHGLKGQFNYSGFL